MESLEMEILSTLPRPRARRRQYFNSDQLMSILMVALASSVETAWRGSMGSFYLGQEGSEISGRATNSQYCSISSVLDLGQSKGDLHRRTEIKGRGEAAQNPSGVMIRPRQ
ncbi:hypothetical protein Acr_27g0001360 [Actinidia rufa]|uniref:Uncharacterized protein n=1 Tax=Actinidia rufa TaxID=165716 RepID=A0A7J0H5L8_9ERIC|nr:hypothetical protein Acr_27g0001360 [Actinidia rufa]